MERVSSLIALSLVIAVVAGILAGILRRNTASSMEIPLDGWGIALVLVSLLTIWIVFATLLC